MMGIVHHTNYLRFCEEARVDWCKKKGLLGNSEAQKAKVFNLAVYESRVKHVKPAQHFDRIVINLQVKIEGVRMIFQYSVKRNDELLCLVETVHCSLDINFKIKRLSQELINLVEKEIWTETWL